MVADFCCTFSGDTRCGADHSDSLAGVKVSLSKASAICRENADSEICRQGDFDSRDPFDTDAGDGVFYRKRRFSPP